MNEKNDQLDTYQLIELKRAECRSHFYSPRKENGSLSNEAIKEINKLDLEIKFLEGQTFEGQLIKELKNFNYNARSFIATQELSKRSRTLADLANIVVITIIASALTALLL